jgi:hypothetical protein
VHARNLWGSTLLCLEQISRTCPPFHLAVADTGCSRGCSRRACTASPTSSKTACVCDVRCAFSIAPVTKNRDRLHSHWVCSPFGSPRQEQRARQRYLDMLVNESMVARLRLRAKVIHASAALACAGLCDTRLRRVRDERESVTLAASDRTGHSKLARVSHRALLSRGQHASRSIAHFTESDLVPVHERSSLYPTQVCTPQSVLMDQGRDTSAQQHIRRCARTTIPHARQRRVGRVGSSHLTGALP